MAGPDLIAGALRRSIDRAPRRSRTPAIDPSPAQTRAVRRLQRARPGQGRRVRDLHGSATVEPGRSCGGGLRHSAGSSPGRAGRPPGEALTRLVGAAPGARILPHGDGAWHVFSGDLRFLPGSATLEAFGEPEGVVNLEATRRESSGGSHASIRYHRLVNPDPTGAPASWPSTSALRAGRPTRPGVTWSSPTAAGVHLGRPDLADRHPAYRSARSRVTGPGPTFTARDIFQARSRTIGRIDSRVSLIGLTAARDARRTPVQRPRDERPGTGRQGMGERIHGPDFQVMPASTQPGPA